MSAAKLKVLPDSLINKIAAGEVVERPASVVKELVENSIDAGANQITIEVKGAGKKLIRVSDNGVGMTKEEIALSVKRHSTSKISKLDDLFAIKTLGFRGEALPSIVSVSRAEICSCAKGAQAGAKLALEGGKQVAFVDWGCPVGTTIEIRDLFYNTPARKKFLKADQTEIYHITTLVSNAILSNPSIAFKLTSDSKEILVSTGSGKPGDALVAVYGADTASQFEAVKGDGVTGFVSSPSISRVDKKYQSFFVNGRHVKNFLLSKAVSEGLVNVIPPGRFPLAVIFIEIDPSAVDVNVHPTKREVRFYNPGAVREAVTAAVRQALVPDGAGAFVPQSVRPLAPSAGGLPEFSQRFFGRDAPRDWNRPLKGLEPGSPGIPGSPERRFPYPSRPAPARHALHSDTGGPPGTTGTPVAPSHDLPEASRPGPGVASWDRSGACMW